MKGTLPSCELGPMYARSSPYSAQHLETFQVSDVVGFGFKGEPETKTRNHPQPLQVLSTVLAASSNDARLLRDADGYEQVTYHTYKASRSRSG